MKYLKKLASVLLALVMVMALAAPAFAATAGTGTITLKNPEGTPVADAEHPDVGKHTYNVYRVFEMTLGDKPEGADKTDADRPMSYTASAALKDAIGAQDSTVKDYFTFTATSDTNKFTVTPTDAYDTAAAKTFSEWLSTNTTLLTPIAEGTNVTLQGPNDTKELTVPYGYYFVDSNVGSLFMLNSTTPDVAITDKNLDPTTEKKSEVPANVKIGDEITYTITINVVAGSTKYVLHDELGAGLVLKADTIEVKVDSTDVAEANRTITTSGLTDGCAFEITFPANYLETTAGKQIIVTYKATITDDAAIPVDADVITLENDAWVKYNDDKETKPGHTDDELYQFDLVKTDGDDKLLNGAEFELYAGTGDDGTGEPTDGATPIKFTYDEDSKTYKVCTDSAASSVTKIAVDGKVTIVGLKGTYYLKETKAPEGYNLLTTLTKVELTTGNKSAEVTDTAWTSGGVKVVNQSGTQLPSTGGIGTTIFYVVGGVLMVGAVVVLIAKRRTGSDEE